MSDGQDLINTLTQLAGSTAVTGGSTAMTTSASGDMVTYKGRKYRRVTTAAGVVLIPYRRARRIVIGEKGLQGVLALIRTGASLARNKGRGGSYSFRHHRSRRW